MCEYVCVRVCTSVCVCEGEREGVTICLFHSFSPSVCVRERERERGRERERERQRGRDRETREAFQVRFNRNKTRHAKRDYYTVKGRGGRGDRAQIKGVGETCYTQAPDCAAQSETLTLTKIVSAPKSVPANALPGLSGLGGTSPLHTITVSTFHNR